MDNKTPYRIIKDDMEQLNSLGYENASSQPPQLLRQETVITQSPQPQVLQAAMPMMTNFNPPVGPDSTELCCPTCRCRIRTKVRHCTTTKTHIACLLLSWTFCCCCLPYCMDSCRNANHFCPMCGTFIGTYQK